VRRYSAQGGHNRPSIHDYVRMSRRDDPDHNTRARTFGKNLREARRTASLSQEELAERADVDRSAISVYERGRREPNLRTIVKLAHALEISTETLVLGL
jgi:DNA-binding XRE family transcriptional regulator